MSKPATTKAKDVVNAYLFYSQRLLNLMNSMALKDQHADKMALNASVCLALKQSWEAWLDELSEYVGITIPDYQSIFMAENSRYPEIAYLSELSQSSHSWLTQLPGFFAPHLNTKMPQSIEGDQEESTTGLAQQIRLVSLDSEPNLSEEMRLTEVLREFKTYIQTVRARQSEW